jgi:NAD+ synthase (glutamine-hydrolysing)
MYIALAQTNPTVGAFSLNAEKALALIDELAKSAYPPDLVIFPAYALSGTPLDGLAYSDALAEESLSTARDFIARASLPTIIGSVLPRPLEEMSAFVCEPEVLYCKDGKGGALGFVDIENSWSQDSYAANVTIVVDGTTISVLLDDYPESVDDYADSALVVLMLSKEYQGTNSMFTASQQLNYLRGFAKESASWVVVANLVGAQDSYVFDGASVILDNKGRVVKAAEPFVEQLITCNLALESPFAASASSAAESAHANAPSKDRQLIKPLLPYEADWKALCLAVGDYVGKNGFSDVVIGLSGGIDSAVTAALAVDALGAERVHGVLMPGPFSSEGSITDAAALAENLGIETHTMPIGKPFETFKEVSLDTLGQEGSFIAQQNLQARIRTIYLMHLSNTFNWLLLNTGNKSEAAMGFSTLYGDTAGAFAPLGNVYKGDVYELAAWRNNQKALIPPSILQKAPSAELYDGQEDQDSLPPYDVLDRILRLHIEDGLGVDQILAYANNEVETDPLEPELVQQVLDTVRKAEYKRRQEPLAPMLGYNDLGFDRNWPITNGFVDHARSRSAASDILNYLTLIHSWPKPDGWSFFSN